MHSSVLVIEISAFSRSGSSLHVRIRFWRVSDLFTACQLREELEYIHLCADLLDQLHFIEILIYRFGVSEPQFLTEILNRFHIHCPANRVPVF